jgi:hypothetical protein
LHLVEDKRIFSPAGLLILHTQGFAVFCTFAPNKLRMYTGLLHLHKTLAYAALVLLFIATIRSLYGLLNQKAHTEGDRKLGLFTLISVHLQFVVGLLLFFAAGYHTLFSEMGEVMSSAPLRYKVIEHPLTMILGVVAVTIGYSRSKRADNDRGKHKSKALFFLIGLALVLSRVPWDRLV